MARKTENIHYIEMGPYPVRVGLVSCPETFAKELKDMNTPQTNMVLPGAIATTHSYTHSSGPTKILVAFDLDALRGRNSMSIGAVCTHESVHVWQYTMEHMDEIKHGVEAQAYFIDYVTYQTHKWLKGKLKK